MAFTTRKSLLAKVREGDEVSWTDFYETYRPLIWLVGNDYGLDEEEKKDLVQCVMAEIFQKDILAKYNPDNVPEDIVFKYDPKKGRFRHFLRAIIRNQAIKIYHKRKRSETVIIVGDDGIPEPAIEPEIDHKWLEEWQKHVLNMALIELKNKVQAETFVAFEMYALQDRGVQEVAEFLSMSVASVYTAKNRCIAALRKIIVNLEEQ